MKKPTFAEARKTLLEALDEEGWVVAADLKIPHATKGKMRLWFMSQAIYTNDAGTDLRKFKNAHSLTTDMREYSVSALIAAAERRHGGTS